MSIVSSTNSGRQNILLTMEYLLQNGWYYISTEEREYDWRFANSPLKIYKNDNHDNHNLIAFINSNKSVENIEDNICFFYYDIDKDKSFRFDFIVKTIGDLDDVEEYWKDSCINEELALKKLALNERAKNAVRGYLKAKSIMDNITNQLTNTINTEIIKAIGIPEYRLDNCEMIYRD